MTSHASGLREPAPSIYVPLMSRRQRAAFVAIVALWVCALGWFWLWWLEPEHNIDTLRYLVNSIVLFWTTVIPGYFVVVFSRARVVRGDLSVPADWRVAMVVTKAPSEPAALVQETLRAMIAQRVAHDTWLADEDPTPEMLAWCARHGVFVSTRKDQPAYHNATWPRRTRCKEGNLAYFYDAYGYERYDFVVQLDADHKPGPGYLEAMLRPFLDPAVGYVSAPSICDSNAADSWSVRGRLHVEGSMHGALQAGYSGGLAPLCIGSHYAVRTTALRAVGGLGPELAEDHSTTLILNAGGWRGVHALDAIAHGDGPSTFADLAIQEFQWSRSLVTILLRYTPRYLSSLPPRLMAQFLFSQAWYPLFSLSMLAMLAIPVIALLTGKSWVSVIYAEFFLRAGVVMASILLLMAWVRRCGWMRPVDAPIASWEGTLFFFARWPWALLGVIVAVWDCLSGRTSSFRVTPKGGAATPSIPFVFLAPYLALSVASGLPVILVGDAGSAAGFYIFAIVNSLICLAVAAAIAVLHRRGARTARPARWWPVRARGVATAASFAVSLLVVADATVLRAAAGVEGLLWGIHTLLPSDRIAVVVAAGQRFTLGVYDPGGRFAATDNVGIEHLFVSWNDDVAQELATSQAGARARNRWLMVTVEPWSAGDARGFGTVIEDTIDGRYDGEIDRVCGALAALGAPIFVRWGHEMEQPTGRYPWAIPDGALFARAYRHFVDRCRGHSGRFFMVWSPRGERGLDAYYPGAAYVDHVGLSVYSLPQAEIDVHGRIRAFAENLGEKYARVKRFAKPVVIAELGVTGNAAHRRDWLNRAFATLHRFPLLEAIVYFNANDSPGAWPAAYGVPDWTLPADELRTATPARLSGGG